MSDAEAPAPTAAVIVPPRPNLGPEPIASGPAAWLVLVGIALVLAALALAAAQVRRRRKGRRARRAILAAASAPRAAEREPSADGPLIRQAQAIRGALVARFGPTWAAKTTEEVAAEAELASLLDADLRGTLAQLLTAADRAKFAGEPPEAQGEPWEACAQELVRALKPEGEGAAGTRSTTSGR